MILQALYEYYNRSDKVAPAGKEYKEIVFLVKIRQDGTFVGIEDTRNEEGNGNKYLVSKSWGRTGTTPQPFHFWDNFSYVFGFSSANIGLEKDDIDEEKRAKLEKEVAKNKKSHNGFVNYVNHMRELHPNDVDVEAVYLFYMKNEDVLESLLRNSDKWDAIKRNLTKNLSFLIEGETEIVAAKERVISYSVKKSDEEGKAICLITGEKCVPVATFTKIKMGKFSDTKLISFQKGSGYDSYGKEQGDNAPISEDAEFKCSTALKKMLEYGSRNKFDIGNRTFVFWASSQSMEAQEVEKSIFDIFGFSKDDPDNGVEKVRKTFESVFNGQSQLNKEGWFYILGIFPANKARIAISYWAEIPLMDFVGFILDHFSDMEIVSGRNNQNYMGLYSMMRAVSLDGKIFGDDSNLQPNLAESVVKSILQGLPYPRSLFSSCIRRVRAETSKENDPITTTRAAILKAYLNRINNNHKITKEMDKDNINQGYLCGRLFAVLDKIQEEANNQHSIRERYMNSASSTPAAVFSTILNLSNHHIENLKSDGRKIYFEKLKQEIISKIDADGFRPQLDLQDQGRFFIGYYHQRQDFFTKNEENNNE
jgi:CRISPR-associated protein Csd1